MPTRILIVDDHPAVREGLAVRISRQPGWEVCGEAADGAEALAQMDACHPDVVIVDVRLKTGDGLDLVKRIKARDESVRVLVWSMYPDSLYARRALRAGAIGYINKENTTGRIIEAIRAVAEGNVYLSHEAAHRVLHGALDGRPGSPAGSLVGPLSDRELEVFKAIGGGLSVSQIAERLHLSVHTVETHRQRIKQKLNLASAAELTRTATRWILDQG